LLPPVCWCSPSSSFVPFSAYTAYDTNAEITAIAAADIVFDMLSILTLGAQDKRTERLDAAKVEDELAASHDEL
jgi:hypothetical protein